MKISTIAGLMLFSVITISPVLGQETAGIGVALALRDDRIVVNHVLPDSVAAGNKAIHVGDQIVAVAQEDGPPVQLQGMKIDDAVPLIRGRKGTTVRLTLVTAGKDESQERVISFVRGELKELARWGDGVLLTNGTKAPNIRMIRLGGKQSEQLAKYAGKVVVLEFWATWCRPCQHMMAQLQSDVERHPNWKDKVALLAVSVDDDPKTAQTHVESKGWSQSVNVWVEPDAIKAFHVGALPTTYVIDQLGRVVIPGPNEDIPAVVERLLQPKKEKE